MHGRSERKRGGRKRAEGEREQRREVEEQGRGAIGRTVGGREIGREGHFKGGTMEDTGQYTIYSAQNYPQRGPCP